MGAPAISYAAQGAATYNAVTGQTVRYAAYPNVTGAGTPGVKLTAGTGAWGALADVVAAKGITSAFWICAILVRTASAAQVFEIELEDSAKNTLAQTFVDLTAATANVGPANLPFPVAMVANAEVQGKVGGAAADSIYVGIIYATLL